MGNNEKRGAEGNKDSQASTSCSAAKCRRRRFLVAAYTAVVYTRRRALCLRKNMTSQHMLLLAFGRDCRSIVFQESRSERDGALGNSWRLLQYVTELPTKRPQLISFEDWTQRRTKTNALRSTVRNTDSATRVAHYSFSTFFSVCIYLRIPSSPGN